MTTDQFDALVDLMAAFIADNEADRNGNHTQSDTIELFRVMSKSQSILVTDSPTEDQPQ
jgi:hypothetical protein